MIATQCMLVTVLLHLQLTCCGVTQEQREAPKLKVDAVFRARSRSTETQSWMLFFFLKSLEQLKAFMLWIHP